MRQSLWSAAAGVLAAIVIGVSIWPRSSVAGALAILAGLAIGGGLAAATLRRQPHTSWEQAQTQVAARRAVILWKPTCMYCTRLRRTLRDDNRIVWVNVWADKDANREVRRLNGGNEYTPTAIIGASVLRNPTGDEVRSALTS